MFTAIGFAAQDPKWGRPGFPWVAAADTCEGFQQYAHLIYNKSWMIKFQPEFWFYAATKTLEPYPEPGTRRAWRKKVRDGIEWLTGHTATAQRYHQPFHLLFLSGRATEQTSLLLSCQTDTKSVSKRDWQADDAESTYNGFVGYLNHIMTLSIRRQKTNDHEGLEEWLATPRP